MNEKKTLCLMCLSVHRFVIIFRKRYLIKSSNLKELAPVVVPQPEDRLLLIKRQITVHVNLIIYTPEQQFPQSTLRFRNVIFI